jgi:hypothetical protein
MWARERSHAIDQFDGVISHSSKPSPLIRHDRRTKVDKGTAPVNTSGAVLGGGEFFWAHTRIANAAISTMARPRPPTFLKMLPPSSVHRAQVSGMSED